MRLLPISALITALATAHMQMSYPPPFRSKHNPHTTDVDYSMTAPLGSSGADFPCKGYHVLLGTPQGRPVATWRAGQPCNMTLEGSATHAGGSCQLSLSYDGGASWTAIHSYIGGCPLRLVFDFTLPEEAPGGEALFAWTWFNRIGNREMYMNCAHVRILSDRQRVVGRGPSTRPRPLESRPAMFAANMGNGCRTLEGADVLFPEPGPDVDNVSDRMAGPVGRC